MESQMRQLPWDGRLRLGFEDAFKETGSAVAAIGAAGLDWKVGFESVYIESENNRRKLGKKVDRHRAVVRWDSGLPLGVVGMRYEPIQNSELLEFVDIFRKEADLDVNPEAIGEFDEGRRVFVVTKLEGAIAKLLRDPELIDVYLIMTNAHDGTAAFRVGVLPIRRACYTQLRLQLSDVDPGTWSFRHLREVKEHVEESIESIDEYLKSFAKVEAGLAGAELSPEEFEIFLEKLIPMPAGKSTKLKVKNRRRYRAAIGKTYRENKALLGKKWGALNAVASWEQWSKPMHAAPGTVRTDWLFARLIMERGNEYANKALRLLR